MLQGNKRGISKNEQTNPSGDIQKIKKQVIVETILKQIRLNRIPLLREQF